MTNLKTDAAYELFEGLIRGSRPHLSRAISYVENGAPGAAELLSHAYKARKGAMLTGVTGSPGVGKSTLVDGIVSELRKAGHTVGVIAVDPSSPFTGGAILGDRVRMRQGHSLDQGVFFRSLATRGHLGGLSRHTGDVVALLDAFGFDHIVIETVGAGQSEVDIMRYAHTVVVALAPGLGDDMQAIKAGILEIGDVFCVNKADLPGAERTRRDIEMMLAMREPGGWTPPVVSSVAVAGKGLEGLVGEVLRHQTYLVSSGLLRERNRGSSTAVLEEYLHLLTVGKVMESASRDGSLDAALDDLVEGKSGPMEMAERLLRRYRE
ncbi:MAG: methylmalonyl Co-A mutase-associated GTPase MeaB [Bacillota bacterium]|nr:methylmalonyl Co-A mutase-associated GTPase MeaB [Candidatus Fermentithermobacillaceae bacterium]